MTGLDVLYWASLFLGGSYLVLSVALGGLSHLASQVHGALDGGAGDIGHVGDTGHVGDVGHADTVADLGHAEFGHADAAHADFGHDIGSEAGADAVGHDGGAGDAHGADTHGDSHADHDVPAGLKLLTFLSPVLASGFFVGFGGAGVLARFAKLPLVPSLAWAAAGGALLYYLSWWVIHDVFGGSQASSHTKRDELVGRSGLVMAPISGSRPGMVYYTIAGTRQSIPAITDDGQSIPVGATVRIRRLCNRQAVVSRVSDDEPPRAHVKGA